MTAKEKSLYDEVTAYLLEPQLFAFRGNQRRLLLIGFHRLMGSSIAALTGQSTKSCRPTRSDPQGQCRQRRFTAGRSG